MDFSLFRCLYVKLDPSTYIHTIHTSLYTPSILPKIPKPPFSPPLLSLALERGGRGVGSSVLLSSQKKHRVLFFYFLSTIFPFFCFFFSYLPFFEKKKNKIKYLSRPTTLSLSLDPIPRLFSVEGEKKRKVLSLPSLYSFISHSLFSSYIYTPPPPIFFNKKLLKKKKKTPQKKKKGKKGGGGGGG